VPAPLSVHFSNVYPFGRSTTDDLSPWHIAYGSVYELESRRQLSRDLNYVYSDLELSED